MRLSVFFLFACSVAAHAQLQTISGTGNSVMMNTKYTEIEGSAYLYADWKQGKLVDRKGNATENISIRFDLYKQEVEILQDGTTLRIDKNVYPQFEIYQAGEVKELQTNIFRLGFKSDDILVTDYCEVLSDGNAKLIRKSRIDMVNEMSQTYGTSTQIKRFEKKSYYFIIIGEAVTKVRLSKSDFLGALAVKRPELEEFIKSNKLKFKNDEDFVTLLRHFDQL